MRLEFDFRHHVYILVWVLLDNACVHALHPELSEGNVTGGLLFMLYSVSTYPVGLNENAKYQ